MKTIFTSKTRVVALILAIVMTLGLAACGADQGTAGNGSGTDDGYTITAPAPEGIPRGNGGKTSGTTSGIPRGNNGGIPRGNGDKTKTDPEKELKRYGDITTVVKSVKTPSKPVKNANADTKYGTVDWSTAANGYITFTAKGQLRVFILEGPNGVQSIFDVAKGASIKVALVDGTGEYQYAIGNHYSDGESYSIQYKNSFNVKSMDEGFYPYLVSTPWGDYANAPEATKKAAELWDRKKSQLENVKAIADWVGSLKYDEKLLQGNCAVYVTPDSVIKNGGGVCNEFSKLLVAMLRSQGVPAYYVIGNEGKHAWVNTWVELESYTKNGTTYSKGAWILIEATEGKLDKLSNAGYDTKDIYYAG